MATKRSEAFNNGRRNPAKRFFQWVGAKDKGYFAYYDKETETENAIEKGFTFLVLDHLTTVTGYDKKNEINFYSNEIRNIKKDVLTVKSKNGIEAQGYWEHIKDRNSNFKFTKSVYIAFYDENKELAIGNIKFAGSSLSGLSKAAVEENRKEAEIEARAEAKAKKVHPESIPIDCYSSELLKSIGWINFSNSRNDLGEIAVQWVETVPDQNGDVEFLRPVFRAKTNISQETNDAADALYNELQDYLKWYFEQKQNEVVEVATPAYSGETSNGSNSSNNPGTATDKQINLLYTLANKSGNLEYDVCIAYTDGNKDKFEDLTIAEASGLIGQLKAQIEDENLPVIGKEEGVKEPLRMGNFVKPLEDDDVPF